MAVTNELSSQLVNIDAKPRREIDVNEWGGKVRFYRFDFTQGAAAGDIGSTMDLVDLPARSRVLGTLSFYQVSAFGAARTLDFGTRAHKNAETGVAIVEDPDRYADNEDVSAAIRQPFSRMGTALGVIAGAHDKLLGAARVFATVAGGTIPAGATIQGEIAVAVE